MEARTFKDEVFAHFARIGAAFAHPTRVEIIDVLSQGERAVESLAAQVAGSVATTSRHLQILAAAGLVTRRSEGNHRIYRLTDPGVEAAYRTLVNLAETHLTELATLTDAFFAHADDTHPVTIDELDEMTRTGNVVLVDVRPASEYRSGHVEGAINIPITELATRIAEIPRDAPVVAYCRGPYCVMAATAVTALRAAGLHATRLDLGYPQLRDTGHPTATG